MPIPSLAGLKASNERLNVVLIVLDTQRVKKMSCYGYDKPTSPNADKIAREGVLFENHFVPACWTLPSHTSMFTGLYPFTHRADMEHAYLDDEYPTWAEVGHELGYLTAAFNPNKWIRAAQADRGFCLIDSCEKPKGGGRVTPFTAERFVQWLEVYRGAPAPFFVFINFGDPHLSCHPSEPFLSQFLLKGVSVEEAMALDQNPHLHPAGQAHWSERQWAILESLNDGCVAKADHYVGAVYDALKREGLLERTVLIVTSDHGDVYHEHPPQMAHVLNVYDTCIHTPLIVRAPGIFEGGKRCFFLVQAVDLLPTFFDVVGVAPHDSLKAIQGISLLRALSGETREFIYAEDPFPWNELERYGSYPNANDMRRFYRFLRTIRDHNYKYIYSSRGEDELYFVRDDVDEQKNLIKEKPEIAREMMGKMEAWLWDKPLRRKPPALNTSPIKSVTPESLRRMEVWRGGVPAQLGARGKH